MYLYLSLSYNRYFVVTVVITLILINSLVQQSTRKAWESFSVTGCKFYRKLLLFYVKIFPREFCLRQFHFIFFFLDPFHIFFNKIHVVLSCEATKACMHSQMPLKASAFHQLRSFQIAFVDVFQLSADASREMLLSHSTVNFCTLIPCHIYIMICIRCASDRPLYQNITCYR